MAPEIVFFDFHLPTYFITLSLIFSGLLLWWYQKLQVLGRDLELGLNLALVILVCGLMGARLLHVIIEEPAHYRQNFLDIFAFWQGGFVYYGGLILGFCGAFFYLKLWNQKSRQLKMPMQDWRNWADDLAPLISLGYALGRGACFLNGCCFGKFCNLPWAVNGRHPTQIYASLGELLWLAWILFAGRGFWQKSPGRLFFLWLLGHSALRIPMEAFRDDPRGFLGGTWSPSSLLSFGLFGLSLTYLVRTMRPDPAD
ncbi:MAG: prolipoprotein diacylglyceryl transferase [Bdellovibrio sp.]